VDPALIVELPARDARAIPTPSPLTTWKSRIRRLRRSPKLVPVTLLAMAAVMTTLGAVIASTQGPRMSNVVGFTAVGMWTVAATCLAVLGWRRRNLGRW